MLESTDIEQSFNNLAVDTDKETLRDLIKLVNEVKADLSDTSLSKELEDKYEKNTIELKKKIGWSDTTTKEAWISAETDKYIEARKNEEPLEDIEKFNDDGALMLMFQVIYIYRLYNRYYF